MTKEVNPTMTRNPDEIRTAVRVLTKGKFDLTDMHMGETLINPKEIKTMTTGLNLVRIKAQLMALRVSECKIMCGKKVTALSKFKILDNDEILDPFQTLFKIAHMTTAQVLRVIPDQSPSRDSLPDKVYVPVESLNTVGVTGKFGTSFLNLVKVLFMAELDQGLDMVMAKLESAHFRPLDMISVMYLARDQLRPMILVTDTAAMNTDQGMTTTSVNGVFQLSNKGLVQAEKKALRVAMDLVEHPEGSKNMFEFLTTAMGKLENVPMTEFETALVVSSLGELSIMSRFAPLALLYLARLQDLSVLPIQFWTYVKSVFPAARKIMREFEAVFKAEDKASYPIRFSRKVMDLYEEMVKTKDEASNVARNLDKNMGLDKDQIYDEDEVDSSDSSAAVYSP